MKKIINFLNNKKGTIDPFSFSFMLIIGLCLIGVILISIL